MHVSTNNSSFAQPSASSGFTLIELMVTIAVLGIIVSIAAPNISNQLANQRVKSTTAILQNALREAKVESVIRRQPITLSFANNSTGSGTIIIKLPVSNPAPNPLPSPIASYSYDAKSSINAVDSDDDAANDIDFKPSKTADERTFTICDSNIAASPRQVIVSALGNVTSELGGSCE